MLSLVIVVVKGDVGFVLVVNINKCVYISYI